MIPRLLSVQPWQRKTNSLQHTLTLGKTGEATQFRITAAVVVQDKLKHVPRCARGAVIMLRAAFVPVMVASSDPTGPADRCGCRVPQLADHVRTVGALRYRRPRGLPVRIARIQS